MIDVALASLVEENCGFSFPMKEFDRLKGPIVYAFLREGLPTYIGWSRHGAFRPASATHHKKFVRGQADEIRIWPTKTAAAAKKLEGILIRRLQPEYNGRFTGDIAEKAESLGITARTLAKYGRKD